MEGIKLKVGITNKRLWSNFIKVISAVAGVLSIVLTIIDIEQRPRIVIALCSIILLVIIFIVMFIFANKKTSQKMKINGTDVNIIFGDIFAQNGIKVIAFNEYFDTKVDDKIISATSLNGIYIIQHSPGADAIDTIINTEEHLKKKILKKNVSRKYGGKTTLYTLGTICPVDDYFLLALTHFDEDNKAYLSLEDYIPCLLHMWDELDIYYAGKPIAITLLGSGITRFNNSEITPQELLKYIVLTFKASKVKFNNTSSLTIVLSERVRDEINLYDIEED